LASRLLVAARETLRVALYARFLARGLDERGTVHLAGCLGRLTRLRRRSRGRLACPDPHGLGGDGYLSQNHSVDIGVVRARIPRPHRVKAERGRPRARCARPRIAPASAPKRCRRRWGAGAEAMRASRQERRASLSFSEVVESRRIALATRSLSA